MCFNSAFTPKRLWYCTGKNTTCNNCSSTIHCSTQMIIYVFCHFEGCEKYTKYLLLVVVVPIISKLESYCKSSNFWNNRLARLPPLRSSFTHFLTVAILEFSKKGISFVSMVKSYKQTLHAWILWLEEWSVWRSKSLSTWQNVENADVTHYAKQYLVELHSADGAPFYFTYIKYVFQTIQAKSNLIYIW